MNKSEKCLRIIINGRLSENKQLRLELEKLKLKYKLKIRVSWDTGDICELVTESLEDERIILVGGGGTLQEAVKGLHESGKNNELAIVPMGTANDFASKAQIPFELEKALNFAINNESQSIDLIQINDEFCLNGLSIGQAAKVAESTPKHIIDIVEKYAYSLTSLLSFFDTKNPVVFKDGSSNDEYIFGYVMNSSSCGGGFNVTPEALVNDGLLDVLMIKKIDLNSIADVTYDLWKDNDNKFIKRTRLSELYLEASECLPLSIDGEIKYFSNKLFIRCLHKAVNVVMPESSPILGTIDNPKEIAS